MWYMKRDIARLEHNGRRLGGNTDGEMKLMGGIEAVAEDTEVSNHGLVLAVTSRITPLVVAKTEIRSELGPGQGQVFLGRG